MVLKSDSIKKSKMLQKMFNKKGLDIFGYNSKSFIGNFFYKVYGLSKKK